MTKRVAVAMSGGVDSSLSAFMLKDKGYDVAGFTMCITLPSLGVNNSSTTVEGARKVCEEMGIEHHVVDISSIFRETVTDYFAAEYMAGRTPNPCVMCNRYIKFGLLFREISSLGFDFMATGHYAATAEIDGRSYLKKPKDKRKDQTYFLYAIDKEILSHLIFPLSDLTKGEVRETASKYGLSVADKGESQDICFISGHDYHSCIVGGNVSKGLIVDTDGNPLGVHKGITKYTVGQRKGLGIPAPRALYVTRIDVEKNLVVVGGEDDLLADGLIASNINLFTRDIHKKVSVKVRYASPQEECSLEIEGDRMAVTFSRPQRAIAPGQSVVIYDDNDTLIGGGVIDEAVRHH